MNTIETAAESDGSFRSRVRVWEVSLNIAIDRPLFGAGFASTESSKVCIKYRAYDDPTTSRAAHSVYFQLKGTLGFVGLILYLILLIVAWQNAKFVTNHGKRLPQLAWAGDLAAMLQVSMVVFVVGGAALSLAYYDVFLTMLAVLEVLRVIVVRNSEVYLRTAEEVPQKKGMFSEAPVQRVKSLGFRGGAGLARLQDIFC